MHRQSSLHRKYTANSDHQSTKTTFICTKGWSFWRGFTVIESWLLSGSFHQIKLIPFFFDKDKHWQLDQAKNTHTPGFVAQWLKCPTGNRKTLVHSPAVLRCVLSFVWSSCQFFSLKEKKRNEFDLKRWIVEGREQRRLFLQKGQLTGFLDNLCTETIVSFHQELQTIRIEHFFELGSFLEQTAEILKERRLGETQRNFFFFFFFTRTFILSWGYCGRFKLRSSSFLENNKWCILERNKRCKAGLEPVNLP